MAFDVLKLLSEEGYINSGDDNIVHAEKAFFAARVMRWIRDKVATDPEFNLTAYLTMLMYYKTGMADLKFSEDGEVPLGSVRLQAGATVIDDFIDQRLETLAREWLGEQQGWRPERLTEPLTPKARTLDDVAEAEWSPLDEDETPDPDSPKDNDEGS